MYNFSYHRPGSVADAVSALNGAEDGKFVAGGQTLLPTMKQRLAAPSDLVDFADVAEMKGITVADGNVTIGAMTCHADVASSADVQNAIPALAGLAGRIGDPAVRQKGTIGGSVANADPAADYPAAVCALSASVNTNKRSIAGDEFFTGLFETALEEDEVIVSISFPIPDAAAYMKFENPASRYAIVGVFVAKTSDGARVGVTGATANAHRGPKLEAALNANFSPDAIDTVELPVDRMNGDIHASQEYRAHLVKVMAKRAVAACG
jgi:carbon-monoxide dehydrogenase medium subunit